MLDGFIRIFTLSNLPAALMIMGDDTYAITRKHGRFKYFTNDFSRMDRTHSKALRDEIDKRLEECGYVALVQFRREMYSRKLTMKPNRKHPKKFPPIGTKKKPVDMLFTGEPLTSLYNSITNVVVTCTVLSDYLNYEDLDVYTYEDMVRAPPPSTEVIQDVYHDGKGEMNDTMSETPPLPPKLPPFDFTLAYKNFGFICKNPRLSDTAAEGDYLKGVFLLGEDANLHWMRLPSFIAKFGKTLTDFTSTYRGNSSVNTKARMALYSQWLGYGDMQTNWFYRRFHQIVISLYLRSPSVEVLDPWKITQSTTFIPDEQFNMFMWHRYKVTEYELTDYLDMIGTITPEQLPVIYSHPVVQGFVNADY